MIYPPHIFTILVLINLVRAQCHGDLEITSNDGASRLRACTTYTGNITIGPEVSGEVNFDGMSDLIGELNCESVDGLTTISADSLKNIAGWLYLSNLSTVSTLSFPQLKTIGALDLENLPALQSLGFNATILGSIYIWNTGLGDMAGIDLFNASMLMLDENPHMNAVSIPTLVDTNWTTVIGADKKLDVDLPSLHTAGLLQFFGIDSLSIPLLSEVRHALEIADSQLQLLSAPRLTTSGGLSVENCSMLHNLSFPVLTNVINGDITIRNNSNLKSIQLDVLQTLGGDLYLDGALESVSFSSLTRLSGNVEVHTTSTNNSICEFFNRLHDAKVVHGDAKCVPGNVSAPGNASTGHESPSSTNGSTLSPSTNSSHPSDQNPRGGGLSRGAIAGIVVGAVTVAIIILVATILFKRKVNATKPIASPAKLNTSDCPNAANQPPENARGDYGPVRLTGNASAVLGDVIYNYYHSNRASIGRNLHLENVRRSRND